MSGKSDVVLGIFAFVIAGFVHGGLKDSNDPELILAATYGLIALGLAGLISGGVELGVRAARE